MATSSKDDFEAEVLVPENVNAGIEGDVVTVKGKLGTLRKDIKNIPVVIKIVDKRISIRPHGKRKKDLAITNTVRSLVRNMLIGVEKGFTYKLKIVNAHFPISVKIKGDKVNVENYFGERSPRTSKIVGESTKVTITGDDVIVQGPSVEDVSQTAANIESSTKMRGKDQRVFLDGLFIYSKAVGV